MGGSPNQGDPNSNHRHQRLLSIPRFKSEIRAAHIDHFEFAFRLPMSPYVGCQLEDDEFVRRKGPVTLRGIPKVKLSQSFSISTKSPL